MGVVVFCGPTLRAHEARAVLDVELRPPAARGDLLEAALRGPEAIGLIDGFFSRVPSVWHKEVLWALSQGIAVYGASSMGALRAAELEPFGMVGVGAVFEQYRSGALEDDDEVALLHADASLEFRPLTEAMVNFRATLRRARDANIIGEQTEEALLALAKETSYQLRTYSMLLSAAPRVCSSRSELADLKHWLVAGRVDQKRADALEMLRVMAERQRLGWPQLDVPRYSFSRTDAWESLREEVERRPSLGAFTSANDGWTWHLNEELLVAATAATLQEGAFTRALALERGLQRGGAVAGAVVQAVVEDFRRERDLSQPAPFSAWLEAQDLTDAAGVEYFEREVIVRRTKAAWQAEMRRHLVDHLRSVGLYAGLRARSQAKAEALSTAGLAAPRLEEVVASEAALWQWYFGEHLARSIPEDLLAYARSMNASLEQLRMAVLREYCYQRCSKASERGFDSWE